MNIGNLLKGTITALCGLILVAAPNAQADANPDKGLPLAEWTILIFMNGDNNLEPDALHNFRQLASVGGTDAVNVVVQFDRIAKYAHTTPDWSQTLRFRVAKGTRPLPADAIEDIGEANMGDGAVLGEFVTWGKLKYPAKKYMLVIWDHGQGWRVFVKNLLQRHRAIEKSRALPLKGNAVTLKAASSLLRNSDGVATVEGKTAPFRSAPGDAYRSASNDETNGDVLYDREIEDSLKAVLRGTKLDVIGFDACLMSMVETAYSLRDVARYMVASEELEPGLGWKYDDWLAAIIANPTQDAATLAKTTVTSYAAAYPNSNAEGPETTLAAVDLSNTTQLAASISDLSTYLASKIDTELQDIIEARAATATYAPGYRFYHVDLVQFLRELSKRTNDGTVRDKSLKVINIISSMIIAKHAGADRLASYGSNGLAIYFPSTDKEHVGDPYAEGGYEKENSFYPVEFVQNEKWSDFLHVFWSRVP